MVCHTIPLVKKIKGYTSTLASISENLYFFLITNRELLYLHGGLCGNVKKERKQP